MPPSHHSSSSHSSGSFHSSGSSFRSYSSHSSSSGSSRSSSRGPSSHSSSSHSSSSYSSSSRPSRPGGSYSAPPRPPKPRVNQPVGFHAFGRTPRYVYGMRHDYVYYPVAWIDSSTGTSYEKGYYDENGNRYDDVSFVKDGKYENVTCHCPYCGRDTILTLNAEDAGVKDLQCPGCGAPMEVKSQLDEYVTGGAGNAYDGADLSAGSETRQAEKRRRRRIGCLVAIGIFLALVIIGSLLPDSKPTEIGGGTIYSVNTASNIDLYGETVYLVRTKGNGFAITRDASAADKQAVWSDADESYYDEETECWIWWNTDVDPNVWQYWYEGISSDYGDYGWMEHDDTGWYIEASRGNWIELPSRYDTGNLWYIED